MEYRVLSNGVKMPQPGCGVYQVTKEECERCVTDALKAGYRLIDMARAFMKREKFREAYHAGGNQALNGGEAG